LQKGKTYAEIEKDMDAKSWEARVAIGYHTFNYGSIPVYRLF